MLRWGCHWNIDPPSPIQPTQESAPSLSWYMFTPPWLNLVGAILLHKYELNNIYWILSYSNIFLLETLSCIAAQPCLLRTLISLYFPLLAIAAPISARPIYDNMIIDTLLYYKNLTSSRTVCIGTWHLHTTSQVTIEIFKQSVQRQHCYPLKLTQW